MKERIKKIKEDFGALKSKRETWEKHWLDIRDYLLPGHGWFEDAQVPNMGEKRHSKIIDGRPTKYAKSLGSMIQTGLASKARPWFKLTTHDPKLAEFGPVKDYLETVERTMYQAFARSNFYETVHTLFIELVGFGTGAMYIEGDLDHYIRNTAYTIGEYWLVRDADGRINQFYRKFKESAKALVDEFGEGKCSRAVVKDARNNPFTYHDVLHVIKPRKQRDTSKKDGVNKRFESVYVEFTNEDGLLREGGYEMFPVMVPRWMVTGPDAYGRGPGMDALGDVKALQDYKKGIIMGVHMEVDPPIIAPSALRGRVFRLPGQTTYYDSQSPEQVKPLMQVQLNLANAVGLMDDTLQSIRETFFNDLFIFMMQQEGNDRGDKTAYEISKRYEEKLLLLGPVIERMESELLDPIIDRVYQILDEQGALPLPPQELSGAALQVDYVSLLSQAQQLVGTQSIEKVVGFAGGLSQLNPQIMDKIDMDQAVDSYASMVGAPHRVVRPDDEVAKIRAQRAKQEEEMRAAQAGLAGIDAAKTMSETNLEGNNALTDMRKAMAGMAGQK